MPRINPPRTYRTRSSSFSILIGQCFSGGMVGRRNSCSVASCLPLTNSSSPRFLMFVAVVDLTVCPSVLNLFSRTSRTKFLAVPPVATSHKNFARASLCSHRMNFVCGNAGIHIPSLHLCSTSGYRVVAAPLYVTLRRNSHKLLILRKELSSPDQELLEKKISLIISS